MTPMELPDYDIFEPGIRYAYQKEGARITDGVLIDGLTDADMEHLDRVEGTAHRHYDRTEIDIEGVGKAWLYVAGPGVMGRINTINDPTKCSDCGDPVVEGQDLCSDCLSYYDEQYGEDDEDD
jgi:gamma-glutamylcyclotransferase (GGCT)/AIG2-like uncharacterized protein YtfP